MNRILRVLRAAAVNCLITLSALGQFETATVLGTIRDSSNAVISGADITLENTQTGIRMRTTTDENGNYELFNVRIGRYKVIAEKEGFRTAIADEFTVVVNARQRVDLTLQVGTTSETIVVTDAALSLEADSSDRGTIVRSEQIVNLPLNGRAYADLALLSPGVRASVLSFPTVVATPRDASFNVNGLRSSLNNFVVDGVDNNSYGTSNQGFSNQVVQLSPDAVQEFKVQTNNYSAEFGRAAGAVINASIKSGTNEFHGAAWEFLRNTQLNAVGFFKPRENRKPTLNQNQFGAVFGGPIKRERMFFFMDYEGFRRVARQLQLGTLPTMEARQGIFRVPDASGNLVPLPIRNPLTGRIYADGIVPRSDMTAFARGVLDLLPAPNRAGTGRDFANNFEALPAVRTQSDKGDIRYDHYISSKLTAFVRYSHRLQNTVEESLIPAEQAGGNGNGFVRVLNQQVATGATYTINPTSLFEFRIGISRTEGGKTPLTTGLPSVSELFGITGLPDDPRVGGGIYAQSVSGFTQFGQQSSNPQFQNPLVINPKVNYTKILGRHSLKTGYEYQAIHTEIDDFHPKYGSDGYGSRFTSYTPPNGSNPYPTSPYYNLADFMFGLRDRYQLVNNVIIGLRQRMHFAYVQDDWKVTDKLTLNLGLRYEFATPQWERNNILSNFDPATVSLIQASDGSIYNRALVEPDRNNFAPRFGAAYKISSKWVVRGGVGISYIHFNRLGGENLLSFNLPGIISPQVTGQNPAQGPCAVGQAPVTCFRPTQDGYPDGFLNPQNVDTAGVRTNHIPRDTRTGYTTSWHFTIQRELASNLLLDIAYVGNRSDNLVILGDINYARPNNPNENLSLAQRRRYSNFGYIQSAFPGGFANYNSLQVKLERRFSSGLYLLNSFTWSKAIDNGSGHLEVFGGDSSRVNVQNLDSEKGLSGYDQPFNNTTTIVYEIPIGKGRRWSLSGLANLILGGWRVSAINNMWSGLPVNLRYDPVARQQVASDVAYRPNVVGDIYTPEDQREWFNYLNPSGVQVVPASESNPFGNAGRNIARSPSIFYTDLGLHKDFPLFAERYRLEFRSEFFNLFNRTNFLWPEGNRSSGSYGQITNTLNPRQVQFAMKLVF
ncbi:MAG: TonB-dependent receptor [Bryobacteraceae bacterium]|nr:TonB-dependent receptor [Bryobacteraceae bacterium]